MSNLKNLECSFCGRLVTVSEEKTGAQCWRCTHARAQTTAQRAADGGTDDERPRMGIRTPKNRKSGSRRTPGALNAKGVK